MNKDKTSRNRCLDVKCLKLRSKENNDGCLLFRGVGGGGSLFGQRKGFLPRVCCVASASPTGPPPGPVLCCARSALWSESLVRRPLVAGVGRPGCF